MQPPIPPRSRDRVAGLRLPELPPRDLERLAAGPHSAPAPSTAPDSATYLPPPPATPTKFGGEGSPADVRGYPPPVTPLLMRGGVVSPGVGGGSGLVLPTLSLPLSGPPLPHSAQQPLPSVSLSLPGTAGLMPPPPPPPPGGSGSGNGGGGGPGAGGSGGVGASVNGLHGLQNGVSQALRRGAPVRTACAMPPPPGSRSGARTTPSSPVACGMSQNEIKKAQNRKSAKRFREAQKQRWKNMADDLMSHKRTIDELRAQLTAQASAVAQANSAIRAAQCMRANAAAVVADGKRSAVSINDLVEGDGSVAAAAAAGGGADGGGGGGNGAGVAGGSATGNASGTAVGGGGGTTSHTHAEAEAALYAQILSNRANGKVEGDGGGEPYVKDLGLLKWCVVVERGSSRIVSVRRGSPDGVDSIATEGLSTDEVSEYRNALGCGKPVALAYCRSGGRVNAVMNPVEGTDRVVVAEFTPF